MLDETVLVGEHYGIATPKLKYGSAPSSDLLIDNSFVGVEIELENATKIDISGDPRWCTHRDGSLRDNGVEFVYRYPLNGINVVESLHSFEAAVKGCKVSVSPRTSVHVHVDASDLTKRQLRDLILLYMIWEDVIFKTYAPERYGNHFCLPFNQCLDLLPAPLWLTNNFNDFANNVNTPAVGRYCAFNLKSIFKFGSVEFRHLGGEYKADTIIEWVNTCLAFKRGCYQPLDVRTMYFEASQHGFKDQLRQYFPKPTVDRVLERYKDENEFHHDVLEGVLRAQHVCYPKYYL